MNAEELRTLQGRLKDLYREQPDAAVANLSARGTLGGESLSCLVETSRGPIAAGLHPFAGGDGSWACSGDMLLEALVACAGVTLRTVATAIGLEIRGGTVTAEGELDFRGTLGIDKSTPVGFRKIRLHFEVDSDGDEVQLANLLRLTERYCVIYQTLRGPADLASSIALSGSS